MKSKKPIVLVVKTVYERVKTVFEEISDFEIVPAPTEEMALVEIVREKDPIAVVLNVDPYTGPLYDALQKGRLIARYGVGCDNIDFKKAAENGLYVTNTPGVLEATVAEFTVFLMGEVLRMPGLSTHDMKEGHWNQRMGRELRGKTCAILGLGAIGKKVSQILSFGFDVTVLALKKTIENPEELKEKYGVQKASTEFSEIAPRADIISLHLPANEETHHYMDKPRLQQLKRGSVLINTGRGALVDENALYDALKKNHISAAGLDVYQHEPYKPLDPQKDLRDLENVVLTPHIGSSTGECSRRMAERVIQNIRLWVKGEHNQMDVVSG
ncbi:NAD(P)-binding domain-containing protein [Aliifodinibius sp. S!AR15-10]|uniref:2-hydroxyacid dehydrogenase n=1 Tax=Aliifodinibius sp. S!AR15-10 TaxID=2950437 RepID=UPI0028637D78|nr:NAD(P)-dependent oxidoreductase [Aliifodinibius sp. S!AR15-10]MDR8393415.1 NAD(P)-binding domain-containing protein [Aliifodinibius sp. S!AR15-10]